MASSQSGDNKSLQHLVVIGGGFGGLTLVRALRKAPLQITLIDRRNFHLFQPLLYQVATGGLSPANIAVPLRSLVKKQKNAEVLLGEVVDISVARQAVILKDGEVPYDTLVVAAGVRHQYFGHPEWEALAPGLKSIENATEIRRRILLAFEDAERTADPARQAMLLTFVVVGGGPTGVELAGTLGELAHHTLRHDFRHINPAAARVLLLEGSERILPGFPPELSARAAVSLERLGVTVRTGTLVTDIQPDRVTVRAGERVEEIATRTVLWAAGVQASPLGKILARETGVSLDRAGRVAVGADLSVPGHAKIFVIGDLAALANAAGKPLPGVAQVAMQQGSYVARLLQARRAGKPLPAFRYKDHGSMATIGRAAAVADLGWVRLWGFPAWMAWLLVHLAFLISFDNRVLVLFQWAWNYLTRNRSARLITGEDHGA